MSSNKDTKDINSLEENVKIDSETDTEVTDKDVNVETKIYQLKILLKIRIKKSKNLKINY